MAADGRGHDASDFLNCFPRAVLAVALVVLLVKAVRRGR